MDYKIDNYEGVDDYIVGDTQMEAQQLKETAKKKPKKKFVKAKKPKISHIHSLAADIKLLEVFT